MGMYKVWVRLEAEYDNIEADSEEEAFEIASDYAMQGGSWQKSVELVTSRQMGMTIEEIRQGLKAYHNGFTGCAGNFQEVVDGALNTVCRYQKIEQILKDIPYGGDATVRRIQEVVEDGK